MQRYRIIVSLVLLGCATGKAGRATGETAHVETRVEVPTDVLVINAVEERRAVTHQVLQPVDSVWAALPAAYDEIGIPVKTMDTDARLIGNRNLRVRGRLAGMRLSRIVDCGSGQMGSANADTYTVTLEVVTTLQPQPVGALVETWVAGFATPEGVSAQAVRCTSTGRLEERLLEALGGRLAENP